MERIIALFLGGVAVALTSADGLRTARQPRFDEGGRLPLTARRRPGAM